MGNPSRLLSLFLSSTRKYRMRSAHIRFTTVLCLVVCCRLAFAKELDPSVSHAAGIIVVAATVEGQSATLLLDTGAERSCLDIRLVARLGLRSVRTESIRQPYT